MGPSAVQPVQFRQHRKDRQRCMAPGGVRGALEGKVRKSHLNALQKGCGSDAAFGTPPDMDVPFSLLDRTPHQPSQPPKDTVRGKPHTIPIRGPTGIVMRYWGDTPPRTSTRGGPRSLREPSWRPMARSWTEPEPRSSESRRARALRSRSATSWMSSRRWQMGPGTSQNRRRRGRRGQG